MSYVVPVLMMSAMSVALWEWKKTRTPVDPETEGSTGTMADDQIPPATSGGLVKSQDENLPTGSSLQEVKAAVRAKVNDDASLSAVPASVRAYPDRDPTAPIWDRMQWCDEHSSTKKMFGNMDCLVNWPHS